jgi:hypothetical protein
VHVVHLAVVRNIFNKVILRGTVLMCPLPSYLIPRIVSDQDTNSEAKCRRFQVDPDPNKALPSH